jgi:Spy/CpxP family protein refolding chaperone
MAAESKRIFREPSIVTSRREAERIFCRDGKLFAQPGVKYARSTQGGIMDKLKTWILGGAALAAVAFAVPMLHADGEGHGRFGRRPGAHRMFGDGAPIISLALKHQDELKLTPDQVANLEKTRTNYQNQVAPLHEQLRTVEGEIASLTQETPANLVQVKLKTQESAKLRSELRYLRIEALENGKSILTAEQRGQLDTLLAARRDEHRRQHKQAS